MLLLQTRREMTSVLKLDSNSGGRNSNSREKRNVYIRTNMTWYISHKERDKRGNQELKSPYPTYASITVWNWRRE